MFFYLPDPDPLVRDTDPDPDPLVRDTDPDLDPSIIKQKIVRKTLIPTVLLLLYDFLSLKNDAYEASKSNKQTTFFSCHLEGH